MEKISLELRNGTRLASTIERFARTGTTPAHLFGHGLESLALQGTTTDLEQAVARAGMSRLVNLKIAGEKRARSVLIREIQRKPVSGLLLHVDLYQVRKHGEDDG